MSSPDANAPPRVLAAARILRIDLATVEAVTSLRDAGVESIVLKGPSFARWLYDDPAERPYTDGDLLIAAPDLETARVVLAGAGFAAPLTRAGNELIHYAEPWIRADDGTTIDLHHRLPGISDSATAWRVLSARTETMPLRGHEVTILDEAARTLHVVLHAAQHGTGRTPSLVDLERAVARLAAATWEAAAGVAREAGAETAFASGLALVEGGDALLERVGTRRGADSSWELAQILRDEEPGEAMVQGLVWLGRVRGLRAKAKVLVVKLFPPRDALKMWSPLASRGRAGLFLARVWRPLWLLVHAPRAIVRYRRARALQRRRRES